MHGQFENSFLSFQCSFFCGKNQLLYIVLNIVQEFELCLHAPILLLDNFKYTQGVAISCDIKPKELTCVCL